MSYSAKARSQRCEPGTCQGIAQELTCCLDVLGGLTGRATGPSDTRK